MVETAIFYESIDYITNNINAKTSEIPAHLLDYWFIPEYPIDFFNESKDLSSFLIFRHAFDRYNQTQGKKRRLSSIEIMGQFGLFQLIIGVTLKKNDSVRINYVDLFDFDNYSKLNITVL